MSFNDLHVPSNHMDDFQSMIDAAFDAYQKELDLAIEEACSDIEYALEDGTIDLQEIMSDWSRTAAKKADDYYQINRKLWADYSETPMPPMSDYGLVDPDRALYTMQRKLINERYVGSTYTQLKHGTNRYGITLQDLWPDFHSVDDAQQFIADMMRTMTRLQTQHNITHDPTNPRWARVPKGKTCAFCLMLASRGFAYTSEEAAGVDNAFHADCDCKIVPSWGSQTLEGYDPDQYRTTFKEARAMAMAAGDPTDSKTVLSWIRSEFPAKVKDGSVFADPTRRLPRDSELAKVLGKHCKYVNRLLHNSPYPDTARLWVKYAKEYRILSTNHKGTAYFSPKDRGIFLNIDAVIHGDSAHRPYQLLFHETGHMLDWLLGNNKPYSAAKKFNVTVWDDATHTFIQEKAKLKQNLYARLDAIEKSYKKQGRFNPKDLRWLKNNGYLQDLYDNSIDFASFETNMLRQLQHIRDNASISTDTVLSSLADRIHSEYGPKDLNVDDMLQATLGDAYPRAVGHDDAYYIKTPVLKAVEAWAEILDAQLSNPTALNAIEQVFPNSVKLFNSSVKELL